MTRKILEYQKGKVSSELRGSKIQTHYISLCPDSTGHHPFEGEFIDDD